MNELHPGFTRNLGPLDEAALRRLDGVTAAVVGCGGLGGYVADFLARAGVGRLRLIDGDRFEPSNLNRQLFARQDTLGRPKASAGKAHIEALGLGTRVTAFDSFLTGDNAEALLRGCDIVMDALDRVAPRLILEQSCTALEIPIIHGAVGEWSGQAAVVLPGSGFYRKLYTGGEPRRGGVLAPTVSLVASLEVLLALRLLTGQPVNAGELLYFDALSPDILHLPLS